MKKPAGTHAGRRLRIPDPLPDVVVEDLRPLVDGGRFHAKAIVGDRVVVSADVFAHGHDVVRAHLRIQPPSDAPETTRAMRALGNDRFEADFEPGEIGVHAVSVLGEIDHLATWSRDARRRVEAGVFEVSDPPTGAALLGEALGAIGNDAPGAAALGALVRALGAADEVGGLRAVLETLEDHEAVLVGRPPGRGALAGASTTVFAQRERAAFSSWYECFPRSMSPDPSRPGTLADLRDRLDYVARLGFDVLYLPPIHPIGVTARKGRNNSPLAAPGDVGSPWAIGAAAGGHEAIAAELGNHADFEALVAAAGQRNIEIALDLAFQCSPDHPWVREHPEWFTHRPDGTIACAENPPKRYEDVYPLNFATPDRDGLYRALLDVTRQWIEWGVRIFRVDNPHTKPFAFWEWMIGEVRRGTPDVLFLSEAFTRPKVMHRLAKLGFDQSYTYFTWRETSGELQDYFNELAHGPGRDYFRPNAWPNTPDILAHSLQRGGRASFVARLVLAAGLSSNYGIYGPVFELLEDRLARPDSEDYLDSEKYEVRHFDLGDPKSIAPVIARVNAARRDHPALWRNDSLAFHRVDNDAVLCWSKASGDGRDVILGVVSLDPLWSQSGFVELDLGRLGIDATEPFALVDQLDGAVYTWKGSRNFVLLDPAQHPAHLFTLRREVEGVPS